MPVYEIAARGVTPVHVAPIAAVGIVLKEEVVFTVVESQTVRVVIPAAPGREVQLRPQGFAVQHLLSDDVLAEAK